MANIREQEAVTTHLPSNHAKRAGHLAVPYALPEGGKLLRCARRRADPGVLGGRRSWQLPPLLAGKPSSNYADLEADQVVMGNEVANCSAEVRAGFIRKVYGILTCQLLLTCLVAGLMSLYAPLRGFVIANPGCLYLAMFLSVATLVALLCYKDRHPHNIALLLL